jgi:uncharacterized protein YlzI (FlbEa/FlbD family)
MKGRIMKVSKIEDNNGKNYIIRDIESFYQHILDYHSSGTSLHEENGHYFTINDEFRSEIKKLYQTTINLS